VGTDDGKLWLTPDSGRSWKDLSEAVPREARGLWVSRVEPSRFEEGRAYVSVTGYREDVFRPMLYVTEDYGLTFQSLSSNLPDDQNINVVREDPRNEDLLFAGAENGAYASVDGGGEWARLGKNLPKVPVHDIVAHPRDRELAIATHGRGMYVLDIASLEQWTESNTRSGAFVVQPNVARRFPRGPDGGYTRAPRTFTAPNPSGAELCAYLAGGFRKAELRVVNAAGKVLTKHSLPAEGGLHRVVWNLTSSQRPAGMRGIANRFRRFFGSRRGRGRRFQVQPGRYRIELEVDGKVEVKPLEVK
ncbi:MAG: WD40/YVTN/BNR-like repeat-containing protein, partial [Planctomycetota bacterium]